MRSVSWSIRILTRKCVGRKIQAQAHPPQNIKVKKNKGTNVLGGIWAYQLDKLRLFIEVIIGLITRGESKSIRLALLFLPCGWCIRLLMTTLRRGGNPVGLLVVIVAHLVATSMRPTTVAIVEATASVRATTTVLARLIWIVVRGARSMHVRWARLWIAWVIRRRWCVRRPPLGRPKRLRRIDSSAAH